MKTRVMKIVFPSLSLRTMNTMDANSTDFGNGFPEVRGLDLSPTCSIEVNIYTSTPPLGNHGLY